MNTKGSAKNLFLLLFSITLKLSNFRSAKFSSGLSVYDFIKRQSVTKITKSGIERLGPSVINLAEYENLHGHANSVKIRIKKG